VKGRGGLEGVIIILKYVSKKQYVMMWTGFIWLRIASSVRLM
jgi:hypothetical protein